MLRCGHCGHRWHEVVHRPTPPRHCPRCGAPAVTREVEEGAHHHHYREEHAQGHGPADYGGAYGGTYGYGPPGGGYGPPAGHGGYGGAPGPRAGGWHGKHGGGQHRERHDQHGGPGY